ncbi:hypothetical protein Syun_001739 [Stephania yunnanensis]|uniref:Uncharacterized protein n=1 Tax=Stephania yunnanensis TaxID=152371 RepID=A0AAP0Q827_9MAGN
MYISLVVDKAVVIAEDEEIDTLKLPPRICLIVFVITGSENVSQGAQEIFRLLPHTFVNPRRISKFSKVVFSFLLHTNH